MQLLVAVIHNPGNVKRILDGFLEIGVQGATVIESTGMARLMADHVSFFSRFAELGNARESHNQTIFTVVESDELLRRAVRLIEEAAGDLDEPDTGFVFAVPVSFCRGFSAETN